MALTEALVAMQISLVAANALMQLILEAQQAGREPTTQEIQEVTQARKDALQSLDESIAAREAADN